jgi:type IV secretory pathway VirB10-like protein
MGRLFATKAKILGISKQNIIWVVLIIIIFSMGIIFWSDHIKSNEIKVIDIPLNNTQSKDDDIDIVMKNINYDKLNKHINKDSNVIDYNHSNISDSSVGSEVYKKDIHKIYSSKILMYISNNKINSSIVNEDKTDFSNKLSNNKVVLKAGSIIPSLMVNGINSDIPGDVIALVRDNVYDSINREYILIPQGAKLVGKYDSNIAYAQDRLAVFWNKLIYPNGKTINLEGIKGSDLSGYSGFYDEVDNHYLRIFGASFVMGVITGAMQYSQNNSYNNSSNQGLNAGQVMSNSLGQQMGQTSLALANKNINVKPTIIIKPNYPFNIMIVSDLDLEPYIN